MAPHFTEDNLSKLGLSFLKKHYRHRPKHDDTISLASDLIYNETIINGILNYKEKNGQSFFAVFKIFHSIEAVSSLFKVSRMRLLRNSIWVSIAIGLMLFLILFLLIGEDHFLFKKDYFFILFYVITAPIFLLHYFLGIHSERYRRLGFMDDVRLCQANEKWIAISELSLINFSNQELEFLKRKCAENGIGLFTVSQINMTELLVPPTNLKRLRKNKPKSRIEQIINQCLPFYSMSSHQ